MAEVDDRWSLSEALGRQLRGIQSPTQRVRAAAAQYKPRPAKAKANVDAWSSWWEGDPNWKDEAPAFMNEPEPYAGIPMAADLWDESGGSNLQARLVQNSRAQAATKGSQAGALKEKMQNLKKTETTTTNADGTTSTSMKVQDPNSGATFEMKSGNRSPYEEQYATLLQQASQPQQGAMNLHPLAQLTDTWTGSRFAQGFQVPEQQERARLAQRIGAARGLYGMENDKANRKLKRQLQKAKTPARKKDLIAEQLFQGFRDPETDVEDADLQSGLNLAWKNPDRIKGAMKQAGLPPTPKYISLVNNIRISPAAKAGPARDALKAEWYRDEVAKLGITQQEAAELGVAGKVNTSLNERLDALKHLLKE